MNVFKLEEYLTKYEFNSPYVLCCSDVESWSMHELLKLADENQLDKWDKLSLAYTEPHGEPGLRALIAKTFYPSLEQNNVLCFAGAEEAIYACLNVLCDKTSHAIVVTPCYQSLYEIPKSLCQSVTTIALENSNKWQLDLNKIEASIQKNTTCMVINFPHNPTGKVLEPSTLENLVTICRKHGVWLFSDEVYRLLGSPHEPWASPAACYYEKAVSLGVMSKAYGMPGLRVGWVACQDQKVLLKFKQYKDYLSICNSAPSELLTEIALTNSEHILAKNNALVRQNITILDAFLKRYSALFSWHRPQGGCIGFIQYHSEESVDRLCHRLVTKHGILLMPSSIYDLDSNFFRIGFGRKNFTEALNLFEEIIAS